MNTCEVVSPSGTANSSGGMPAWAASMKSCQMRPAVRDEEPPVMGVLSALPTQTAATRLGV